ncbi:uncharacterized protein C8A04DRAFT_40697 [Dichotomopilus funicola]|uniref:Zn(2)-C6 fungal-type domain-containing protein n=1 Tax=Dichotomopilus funicola TaxID=1934379 RepID=A0AAN6UUS8_9PEZI|nr:hypothetical protein C8A04DRAFT_40697 [Dichotomopilus funicola]
MVFPGHFSTGCLRCRQRKVKCDETKPSCRRCMIYGKPCTGYTDQFQFRHRRNPAAGADGKSARGKKRREKQEGQEAQQGGGEPQQHQFQHEQLIRLPQPQHHQTQLQQLSPISQSPQRQQSFSNGIHVVWPSPPRAPDPCYDTASLSYFISRFVTPNPEDGFPGHLSHLPALYDAHSSGGGGLLEAATLAVAQMAAYNRFGGNRFKMESYRHYGRAIKMLRDNIASEETATDDKVITSILLLCALKDISGELSTGNKGDHAAGLYYLIEKRGPEQITTGRGAELLFLSLIRLQMHSFLNDDDTYVDPGAITTVWGTFDPLLRALAMMSRTLALRQHVPDPDAAHPDEDPNQAILRSCSECLDEFHHWDVEAAAYWQTVFKSRSTPTALGEIASGTTHYDAETACTIILIRSARLILLVTMLTRYHLRPAGGPVPSPTSSSSPSTGTNPSSLPRTPPHTPPTGSPMYHDKPPPPDPIADALAAYAPLLTNDVSLTIDDILASVPYALSDISPTRPGQPSSSSSSSPSPSPSTATHDGAGALVIVHSIRLVASCAFLTPSQKERATAVLGRLYEEIGIRAAVGMGEGGPEDGEGRMGKLGERTRWGREQTALRERLGLL